MTEASGPQESAGPPPTTASGAMSPQQEPSTGSVPEGHLDITPGHPSPTGTTTGDNAPPTPQDHHNGGTRTSLTKRN